MNITKILYMENYDSLVELNKLQNFIYDDQYHLFYTYCIFWYQYYIYHHRYVIRPLAPVFTVANSCLKFLCKVTRTLLWCDIFIRHPASLYIIIYLCYHLLPAYGILFGFLLIQKYL